MAAGVPFVRTNWPLDRINEELGRPDGFVEIHQDGLFYTLKDGKAVGPVEGPRSAREW